MAPGIDPPPAFRVIGGRRRYNAMRRRKAEARRESLDVWLGASVARLCLTRGTIKEAARVFGVHPSTICRDVQRMSGFGIPFYLIDRNGAFLCSFERACQGGPVGRLYDDRGRRIKGAARRALLRRIPRYAGWRSRRRGRLPMPRNW